MTALAPLVGLGFLLAAGLMLWRPQYAAVAVLVMFPLEQLAQSYFMIAQAKPILVNASVALVAGTAVLLRMGKGERVFEGYANPVCVLIWALYGYCWFSMLWSPSMGPALAMLKPGLAYWFLLMVIAPLLFGNIASIRPVFVALLVVGSIISLLILASPNASFYAGRLTIQFSAAFRDIRGNPLALAEMGGLMAIVAALLVGSGRNPLFLAIRISALIVGLGLGIASGSRGQVIAAVAAGFIFLPLARRVGNFKQFLGLGVGAIVLYFVVTTAFSLFIGAENESRWQIEGMRDGMETRLESVGTLMAAWAENPAAWLLGLGSNAFNHHSQGGNYVHNMVIEILCEQGLIGFGLFVGALWFAVRAGYALLQIHRDDPELRSTVAALAAICVYGLLLSLKQGSLLAHPNAFFPLVILAKAWAIESTAAATDVGDHEFDELGDEAEDLSEEGWKDGDDDDPLRRPTPARPRSRMQPV